MPPASCRPDYAVRTGTGALSLPPAVLLTAQLASGVLFGMIGVLLATPLTVVLMVLVQMLYIRDVLGEPIQLLGEHPGKAGRIAPGSAAHR
jgi:hypothetical protein